MLILSKTEVLQAVVLFLQQHYETTKPDDTGLLVDALRNPQTKNDDYRKTIYDWHESIKEIKNKALTSTDKTCDDLTEEKAFEIMYLFLEKYYSRTKSDDIGSLLGDLMHGIYGATADPAAWYIWQECLQQVISARENHSK